ncbi:MAG: translation elongation factor Ts [Candidatus Omnitrophica bacterium]|nr:translation elongation factor Ts [Candidatus Omnitrophota bacterium]
MDITIDTIKDLREMTSCGVIECKNALEEAGGDMEKAKQILKKRGLELAAKKGGRTAKEGRIEIYIHPGAKIGVMVEVNCETDFVAKTENFCRFTKDVAMHIAAINPKYVKKEDVPEDVLAQENDQEAFVKETCLMEQPFVKDPKKTIRDYVNELIASVGENIFISRFVRYKVNEVE